MSASNHDYEHALSAYHLFKMVADVDACDGYWNLKKGTIRDLELAGDDACVCGCSECVCDV